MPCAHRLFTFSKLVIALNKQISMDILTTFPMIKVLSIRNIFYLRNQRNGRMEMPGKDPI